MSDNQRRALCRITFLLTCFLPTGIVGYWICHPQTAASWERAIQAELGLTTKIDLVETPGPYETILRNLEFTDPELGTLFKVLETRILFGKEFNYVEIPHSVKNLDSRGLACLVKAVNQNVVRKHGARKHWKIVFAKPTLIQQAIQSGMDSKQLDSLDAVQLISRLTIEDLQLEIGPATPHAEGTFAVANFRVANSDSDLEPGQLPSLIECVISKTDQHGSVVQLETNDNALPVWLVDDVASLLKPLGPTATFRGGLRFGRMTPTQQRLELAGEFQNVNPSTVLARSDRLPAKIEVYECVYDHGDLNEWHAVLFHDQDSPGIRIRKDSLFNFSKQVDIAQAFSNSLLPQVTSAELERNRR